MPRYMKHATFLILLITFAIFALRVRFNWTHVVNNSKSVRTCTFKTDMPPSNATVQEILDSVNTHPVPAKYLECKSPVFYVKFEMQRKDGRFFIEDLEQAVLEQMFGILKSADKLGMEGLKTFYANEIAKRVKVDNALEVYILGDIHKEKILMDRAVEIMKRNKFQFLKDPETHREFVNRFPHLAFKLATS